MGDTTSKNAVNLKMDEVVTDYNNNFQSAWLTCTEDNSIAISDCKVVDTIINQEGACSLNQNFSASSEVENIANQCEKSEIKQLAEAMSQNMSLNPGSTTASNVTNASQAAINTVTNNISQNCTASTSGVNSVHCMGSTLRGDTFNQKQIANSFQKCTESSKIKNEATQSLTSIIDQHSKAVQKNAIFWILIATAILFISFGVSKKLGGQEIIEWVIILLIVLAVTGLLMMVVYEAFNHGKTKTTKDDECPDCSAIKQEDDCTKALCLWDKVNKACSCDTTSGHFSCDNQCPNFKDKTSCGNNKCYWDPAGKNCIGGLSCRNARRNM